jgi:hypothetical protein
VNIIQEYMLNCMDGIERWHYRHDAKTATFYVELARKHNMLMIGSSDCHQKPTLIGTLDIPDRVVAQFGW